ncbi:hypothetical protein AB870_20850 [Pandoraea faecigallinarum]|uniref:Uncharacterized protein n=1 Tax=Pandoraea faecigallinarum TaxID=656179 RepID=A0A0H3WZN1_9BURK|nr:hypothetical protein [Pandoraea faecigallinarum]AKM32031.1 hypothetical protein AB870_20850 [Pandoraea faecigallinarum]
MTQTKFELQKRRGLKIDAGVRRGPPTGKTVGARGKRGAGGSKLLGALLGAPSEEPGTTGAEKTVEPGKSKA